MQTELLRGLKDSGKEITASPVSPVALGELVKLVESGKITGAVAKKVFATMFESGRSAAEIVAAEGLGAQVSDVAIEQAAREVIAKNPANVAKFKSGNEGVFKFFVGQVTKAKKSRSRTSLASAFSSFSCPRPALPVEPSKRPSFVTQRGNSTGWARPSSA